MENRVVFAEGVAGSKCSTIEPAIGDLSDGETSPIRIMLSTSALTE